MEGCNHSVSILKNPPSHLSEESFASSRLKFFSSLLEIELDELCFRLELYTVFGGHFLCFRLVMYRTTSGGKSQGRQTL